MDRIDAMKAYVRVAELGSFTVAAQHLGWPKASVSTAVQQLESSLGTRLLHRTTRRVQTTPDGQDCLERCRDLLADLDDLGAQYRPGRAALQGRLRVDMPVGAARSVVMPQLPAFMAAHPGLAIELSSTDRRVDLVREGFDCVLRVGTLADSSLVARPLGHYALHNLASRDYVARHGRPRTLDDLAHHRLVHYVPTLGGRSAGFEYVDAEGQARSVAMPGALTVNHTEAYEQACLAGLGIIQAPVVSLRPRLLRGELVEVLPDHRAAPMPVSIVYPHRRQLPQRVQVFMAWLAEVMAPHLLPVDQVTPATAAPAHASGRGSAARPA